MQPAEEFRLATIFLFFFLLLSSSPAIPFLQEGVVLGFQNSHKYFDSNQQQQIQGPPLSPTMLYLGGIFKSCPGVPKLWI